MKDFIIYIIGYGLSISMVFVAVVNFIKDKKRFNKAKIIAQNSVDKISEKLHKNKDDMKEKMVFTSEQFNELQKVVSELITKSETLTLTDKSYLLHSMYQPTLKGQESYLSNLFLTSGATGSFVITENKSN